MKEEDEEKEEEEVAFYQGLELEFVFGAITAVESLASLGLVLRARDYNLAFCARGRS